ncbi:MAG: hypothetical protein QXR88_02405 [Candidatus Pacearchaeota archaeon]
MKKLGVILVITMLIISYFSIVNIQIVYAAGGSSGGSTPPSPDKEKENVWKKVGAPTLSLIIDLLGALPVIGPMVKDLKKLAKTIAKREWGGPTSISESVVTGIVLITSGAEASILTAGAGDVFPEKPLPGNKYCHLCNWDNYTICTPERCKILGNCYYQPLEDERQGLCLPKDCQAGRPQINYLKAEFLVDRTSVSNNFTNSSCPSNDNLRSCSINITQKISHKVDTVRVTLNTLDGAECYYVIDKKNANLSDMIKIPVSDDGNYFLKTRTFEIDLKPLELGKTHTIYFKCRSTCDIAHDAGYDWNFIKFTFEEKPDELPPIIVRVKPDDKRQYLNDKDKYALIEVWLDENGNCSFSDKGWYMNLTKNASINIDCNESNSLMCHFGGKRLRWPQCNNSFFVQNSNCTYNKQCVYVDELGNIHYLNKTKCSICYINISLHECFADIINWSELNEGMGNIREYCNQNPNNENCTKLKDIIDNMPEVQEGVSKLFSLNFRCWDTKGNLMKEEDTYEYRILTYPPYNMTIIEPKNGSITYEKEIYIEVNTSRPTICKYSIDKNMDFENMSFIEGEEILDTNHTGYTPYLSAGTHTLYVKCRDIGGLEMQDMVKFTIQPAPLPKIIRMWANGNDLEIETDIPSICVFSVDDYKKCNYNALNATNFSTLDNYLHLAPLVMEWTYYIKCIDKWQDNKWPNNCTIIIKPFELPRE